LPSKEGVVRRGRKVWVSAREPIHDLIKLFMMAEKSELAWVLVVGCRAKATRNFGKLGVSFNRHHHTSSATLTMEDDRPSAAHVDQEEAEEDALPDWTQFAKFAK
jgi:hypothetical protein